MTKGREKEVWTLEPEGEAERPEATVPWNVARGVSVNPEGEKPPRAGTGKNHWEGKRKSNKKERKGRWKGIY